MSRPRYVLSVVRSTIVWRLTAVTAAVGLGRLVDGELDEAVSEVMVVLRRLEERVVRAVEGGDERGTESVAVLLRVRMDGRTQQTNDVDTMSDNTADSARVLGNGESATQCSR